MRRARPTGVLDGVANLCNLYGDSTGMQVKVDTGEVWIEGQWGINNAIKVLPIAAADPTNPRYDLVVARNDFVGNNIVFDVLKGTAAASPTFPVVTQNTAMWEIPLGYVRVNAGVGTIAANVVTAFRQTGYPAVRLHSASSGVVYTAGNTFAQTFDTYDEGCADISFDQLPPTNGTSTFSSAVAKIYFNRSGIWTMGAGVRLTGTTNGNVAEQGLYLALWKNTSSQELVGATYTPLFNNAGQVIVWTVSHPGVRITAGDYVQVKVTNNSLHSWSASPAGGAMFFGARWLQY